MKKIYGFLGATALLALGACSNDTLDGPSAPNLNEGQKGDLVLTLNVSMASQVGSRTGTPDQGYEIGKDRENSISNAVIVLADGTDLTGYTVKFVSSNISSSGVTAGETGTPIPGGGDSHGNNPEGIEHDLTHANTYKTTFTFDRQKLLTDIQTNGTAISEAAGSKKQKGYTIFVIANPTAEIISALETAATSNGNLQSVFTATTNDEYWRDNRFLMTNAYAKTRTITEDEIAPQLCTTKESALQLGSVVIQRAMSRFDLDLRTKNTNFEGNGSDINGQESSAAGLTQSNIHVQFDAVAMVNMAKTAYLFKVMAANENELTNLGNPPIKFGDEREAQYSTWWTVTPDQTAGYHNQLFENFKFGGTDGTDPEASTGNLVALKSFFDEGADYQVFAQNWEEDNTFEHTGHQTPENLEDYRIWRYCMENTNPWDAKNQINGNTTGVIYRAILSDKNTTNKVIPEAYGDENKVGEPIYAYGNVILGTAEQLFKYATNDKPDDDNLGVYEGVSPAYWAVIKPYYDENWDSTGESTSGVPGYKDKNDNSWWVEVEDTQKPLEPGQATPGGVRKNKYHHGDLNTEAIQTALKAAGFSIYRPTNVNDKPVYYCYYLYWNRHNDNGYNTIMGDMEFATVRNNVYKLSVTKVLRLGHPGDPKDDPYPPTPDTPDEEDIFWLQVECKVLPWEVRINSVEF